MKNPAPVGRMEMPKGVAGNGLYTVDSEGVVTTIIDEDGNIDAPVTTNNLSTTGNTTLGDTSADTLTVNATSTFLAPVTTGVDGTGHDVKFFSATAGKSWLWDESADSMIVTGNSSLQGTLTVGVDATGFDVKFFGDTASKFMVWDQSADDLILADAVALQLGGDESTADGFKLEFDGTDTLAINALTADDKIVVGGVASTDFTLTSAAGTVTLDASANTLTLTGVATTMLSTLTVGVDDTGHDVQFFGATTGKSFLWDESADKLIIAGSADVSDGIVMSGTPTNGLLVSGATTTGVNVTGNATSAFETGTGTFTNGVLLGGTLTNGISIGAATTGINITGNVTTGLLIAGTQTDAIRINGAGTNLLAFDAVEGAISVQATALAGLSATHKIAIAVDGVGTLYIPILTAFA